VRTVTVLGLVLLAACSSGSGADAVAAGQCVVKLHDGLQANNAGPTSFAEKGAGSCSNGSCAFMTTTLFGDLSAGITAVIEGAGNTSQLLYHERGSSGDLQWIGSGSINVTARTAGSISFVASNVRLEKNDGIGVAGSNNAAGTLKVDVTCNAIPVSSF
jgi:hypothetical protein